MTSCFRGKKLTLVCLKEFCDLQHFWHGVNASEQCKSSKLAPNSHTALHKMLIKKITAVKFCMSLHKHHDITLATNDAAAYTLCLRTHSKLILSAILLTISILIFK